MEPQKSSAAIGDLRGYLRAKEPGMREKAYAWRTAIGLQKVDGLTPSDYLIETAKKNIEGEITLAERYLAPAIDAGLIEMTQPNNPRSPTQRYRLTVEGLKLNGGVR